jgi:hypothetical protein
MPERRKKKRLVDLFGFDEKDFLVGQNVGRGGSGYSMSVTYDAAGKPVVQVKIYGGVDEAELRRDIEQKYPGAKIEGLEKKPLIRIVDEEEAEKENSG